MNGKKLWKKWKKTLLILLAILGLGFFLRVYKLTYLPVFGDEAIYIRWAQVMRVEPTLRFMPLSDGKQPLFMWVVIPFLKIFSNPVFAGRLVSVLTGMGTMVGVFVLTMVIFGHSGAERSGARESHGRSYRSLHSLQDDKGVVKIALIASLIYAVSPFSVFFDRMAMADSMLSFFGIWALTFSLITVKKVRLDSAMLAGFFLGGASLTKSPALYFVLFIPSSLFFAKRPKKLKDKLSRLSVFVFLFTFTYAIAFGLYNILRLGPNFHMIAIRNKDYVYPLSHILERPLDPLLPFLDRIIEYLWMIGPSVLIILIVAGIVYGFCKKRKETLLLFIWSALPILTVAEFSKTMTARYIYFSIPYAYIISTLPFMSKINRKVKGSKLFNPSGYLGLNLSGLANLLKILLLVFVIHALWIDFQLLTNIEAAPLPRSERSGYLEEWTAGTGIENVAKHIREEIKNLPAGRQVVVGTEGYFGTLPDGLQIYLNDLPEITIIGTGLDFNEIPQSLVESKQAGNKTYFVVNSTRLLADYEKLDLKLIAEYPKAIRPDGSRESLYFFEVLEN
jgi:4-amino-4-deoxy-L-arabinose transferase-like glycosyltransferase